jgi:hypothetical protein
MLPVNDLYCDRCSALHDSGSFAHHQELILNCIAAYFMFITVFAIGTGRVCRWQFSYRVCLVYNVGVILLLSMDFSV